MPLLIPGFDGCCCGGVEGAWEVETALAIVKARKQLARSQMRKRQNPLDGYGGSVSHRGYVFRISRKMLDRLRMACAAQKTRSNSRINTMVRMRLRPPPP